MDGSACLYIRDVNSLLDNDCHVLRQVVAMYPNLKWFIIGGSPCQDLTFAGPSQGLLGLVGSQSRLFFVLLCTTCTMQVLAGPKSVCFVLMCCLLNCWIRKFLTQLGLAVPVRLSCMRNCTCLWSKYLGSTLRRTYMSTSGRTSQLS